MPKDRVDIFSKIRGVSDHQPATAFCSKGTVLRCVREPQNKYDRNAIKLAVHGGLIFKKDHTLGYISADLADRLAPLIDRGLDLKVMVKEVTGIKPKKKTRGVNIMISYSELQAEQIKKDIAKERAIARNREAKRLRELVAQKEAEVQAKIEKRERQKEQVKAGVVVVGKKFKRGFMKVIDPGRDDTVDK